MTFTDQRWIINASVEKSLRTIWSAYNRLGELCRTAENSGQSHPFLWETPANFSTDRSAALEIYSKALTGLVEDIASIKLTMAQLYLAKKVSWLRGRPMKWLS